MTADLHRVTVRHIQGLTVDKPNSTLADTDAGLRYIQAGAALVPGSGVRRLLLSRTELVEEAGAVNVTLAAYVRDNASRIAAELNELIGEPPARDEGTS